MSIDNAARHLAEPAADNGPVSSGRPTMGLGTPWTVDAQVAQWFFARSQELPVLVDLGEVLAVALHPMAFRLAVAVVAVRAWRAGRRRGTAVIAGTMAVGGALGGLLKVVVQRPRPPWDEPLAAADGYAMPSGHALNAALGCALLLVLAWPHLGRGRRRVAVGCSVVVIALAAVHRLVLGVHHLTDVAAGVVLGLVMAGAAVLVDRRLAGRVTGRRAAAAGSR